ncbi:hypothetical protein [Streptomyces sp. NPDC056323]|uniref:hypothetical protein n=1 Tax=Streptomyces sp. NPDC056323 TaxID=3345784 RepID=UPI0035DD04A2
MLSSRQLQHVHADAAEFAWDSPHYLFWWPRNGAPGLRADMVGLQGVRSRGALQAKGLIAQGRIGRVLSASLSVRLSGFGNATLPRTRLHTLTPESGTNLLTVGAGHALATLTTVLGPLGSLSAASGTRVAAMYNALATAITTGGRVSPGFGAGLATHRLLAGIERSAQTGSRVEFSDPS